MISFGMCVRRWIYEMFNSKKKWTGIDGPKQKKGNPGTMLELFWMVSQGSD
jgi:hypothetical protein